LISSNNLTLTLVLGEIQDPGKFVEHATEIKMECEAPKSDEVADSM
jgi:hypothetical protein